MDLVPRYRPLILQDLSEEQRAIYGEIAAGPRDRVLAPFHLLLQSPILADHAQHLGAYLRYCGALPRSLSELVILAVAKYWGCSYEWEHHLPIALAAGLSKSTINAIEAGTQLETEQSDEKLILRLCGGLLRLGMVDDCTFNSALARFGQQAVVEAIVTIGYYSMLAMLLNAYRVPPNADGDLAHLGTSATTSDGAV